MLLHIDHNLKPLSDNVKPLFQKSAQSGCLQESRFSEDAEHHLLIWGIAVHPHLVVTFEILVPIFTKSISERKKKTPSVVWVTFFFYKTTSTTKLYAIRVAGIIQYYSDHLGKLYNTILAIVNCIQNY